MANTKSSGRPTKFRKEFCQQLIDHMSQGLSFDTFAGRISVNPDSLYEWVKKFPIFSEAKKIATAKRNFLVESMYVQAATGAEVRDTKGRILKPNTAMMIYWTKNTLGWSDKVEAQVDQQGSSTLTLKYKLENGD